MNHRIKIQTNKADQLFRQAFDAHQAGRLEYAKKLYLRILKSLPSDMETMYLLGTAYSQTDDFDLAKKYLASALQRNPNHVESLNNMGLTLKGLGRPEEALIYYKRALALRSNYADAHSNMGNSLEFLGRYDEAETHLRKALELAPDHADALCNLGLVLNAKDRFDEAAQCFLRGLQLRPNHAISYNYLGSIYKIWGRFNQALECLDKAVALSPDTYSPHNNRGAVLEELGRYDEALLEYQRAAEIEPNDPAPRWNQAYLYLRQGVLDRGWEAHELRLRTGGQVSIRFPYPEWDGASLEGKTILIYAEQGLGDEILFASCIPDVIARAGRCIIECAPRLEAWFRRSFPTATVVGSDRMEVGWLVNMPKIDVQVAAGSLPRFLRPTVESFPSTPAYLLPDEQRAAYWRSRVAQLGTGLKVGICWRSGLVSGERHKYYSDLTQWVKIFDVPGVQFINLQYGECVEELQAAKEMFGVSVAVFEDIDLRNDIDDSAALMAALDLVISAPTAVAEMAGALGVETYRIDYFGKQWVSLGTDYMPWHPSVKVFSQLTPGDWDTQLAVIGETLRGKATGLDSSDHYVELDSGLKLATDSSLDDVSRYVLQEQNKWFDPEYEFVLAYVKPGMRVVDIGAGVGAYSLPVVKKVGNGHLWAVTSSARDTNLLLKSRLINGAESHMGVIFGQKNFLLDDQADVYGLDQISFVRLAEEFCRTEFLDSGRRFFADNSPLVMFRIRIGGQFNDEAAQWFIAQGYKLFRFVPGQNLLVPCMSTDELDSYSLNLFACKADLATMLGDQGIVVLSPSQLTSLPGVDQPQWKEYLASQPYAATMLDQWLLPQQREKDWEVYWMALNLFSLSTSGDRSAGERHALLQSAANIMSALVQGQANMPRLLSFCRILFDIGKREMAVNVLNQMCSLIHSGMSTSLNEPFLVLADNFAATRPGVRSSEWSVAMVLAQREQMRAFSTYFTGQESLSTLEEVQRMGFGTNEISRKITLIKTRFNLD